MKRTQASALIVVVLLLGMVVGMKVGKVRSAAVPAAAPVAPSRPPALPRLVDLGSTTCIPCKKLAPILDELKVELKGKVDIEFIDVTKDTAAADKYGIQVIPTQIMLDQQGKELFRHEGFIPKADLLSKLHELKMLPAS